MHTSIDTVNGQDCNIEIFGGDESDHSMANSRITELSDTDLTLDEISSMIHDEITEGWHDSNGFSISITPIDD